jgi:nicotinate-nucleotide adenylyltransferase
VGALRIGVLGGTFDPIHIAHLVLAQEARWQLRLERVLLIPAGQPWRKEGRAVSNFAARAEMTRLAAEAADYLEVSPLEGERPGPSYIVDTLGQLKHTYPDDDLVLILGEDALADLPNWKDPDGIRRLAQVAVAFRGERLEERGPREEELIEMPRMDISSTMIRERVRAGKPWEFFVPAEVASYIKREGLYLG